MGATIVDPDGGLIGPVDTYDPDAVRAARRGYAAGSRDGAREMRLTAARLVEAAGCNCFERQHPHQDDGHYPDCPAALAEAIRRLAGRGGGS